jgi:uncharacterized protein
MLRRLFELGCRYSGQILSYTKILGQLQDAGNSAALAHYLELLARVGTVRGLQKYAGEAVRQRGSSPKLQVFNTALMTAQSSYGLEEAKADREYWGHLVESAIECGPGASDGRLITIADCLLWDWSSRTSDYPECGTDLAPSPRRALHRTCQSNPRRTSWRVRLDCLMTFFET